MPRLPVARRVGDALDTYNIYMDEAPSGGELDGDEGYEVEFRVVADSTDDGNPEVNAVLAGLDLVDLINLRDALQQEIDNFALSALEAQALVAGDNEELR
jgi:hypothetical protein